MDSKKSIGSIGKWLSDSALHNNDYILPSEGYNSLNEFFTRNLKHGIRTISSPEDNAVIVSPADGVINWIMNDLTRDTKIPIKGRMALNLSELFDQSPIANQFIGGTAVAIFFIARKLPSLSCSCIRCAYEIQRTV